MNFLIHGSVPLCVQLHIHTHVSSECIAYGGPSFPGFSPGVGMFGALVCFLFNSPSSPLSKVLISEPVGWRAEQNGSEWQGEVVGRDSIQDTGSGSPTPSGQWGWRDPVTTGQSAAHRLGHAPESDSSSAFPLIVFYTLKMKRRKKMKLLSHV